MSDKGDEPIVVVGSGLAGWSVIKELRKLDRQVPLALVTEDAGEFYSKPMLSNAFALKKAPSAIASATAAQLSRDYDVTVHARRSASAIDRAAHALLLDGGQRMAYAKLVLAVGGRPIRLRIVGDASDRVLSVNNLEHYQRLREHLRDNPRVVILGGGLVGCEFANDLVAAGHEVHVVDVAPRPLARFWPGPMADLFRARLEAAGVRWHLGRSVERIDAAARGVVVKLDDGRLLETDTVLSAVGLTANTGLAETAGLAVNRGVVVDRYLRTADPDIHAIGDCAEVGGFLLPFIMPIMHASRALARTLAGEPTPVVYPAMPVALKTPACPAVFFPPATPGGGKWTIEGDDSGMRAFYRASDGTLLGAALCGACTRERETIAKQLPGLFAP
jgi:rubredoxin-NAD+ reductase